MAVSPSYRKNVIFYGLTSGLILIIVGFACTLAWILHSKLWQSNLPGFIFLLVAFSLGISILVGISVFYFYGRVRKSSRPIQVRRSRFSEQSDPIPERRVLFNASPLYHANSQPCISAADALLPEQKAKFQDSFGASSVIILNSYKKLRPGRLRVRLGVVTRKEKESNEKDSVKREECGSVKPDQSSTSTAQLPEPVNMLQRTQSQPDRIKGVRESNGVSRFNRSNSQKSESTEQPRSRFIFMNSSMSLIDFGLSFDEGGEFSSCELSPNKAPHRISSMFSSVLFGNRQRNTDDLAGSQRPFRRHSRFTLLRSLRQKFSTTTRKSRANADMTASRASILSLPAVCPSAWHVKTPCYVIEDGRVREATGIVDVEQFLRGNRLSSVLALHAVPPPRLPRLSQRGAKEQVPLGQFYSTGEILCNLPPEPNTFGQSDSRDQI